MLKMRFLEIKKMKLSIETFKIIDFRKGGWKKEMKLELEASRTKTGERHDISGIPLPKKQWKQYPYIGKNKESKTGTSMKQRRAYI